MIDLTTLLEYNKPLILKEIAAGSESSGMQ